EDITGALKLISRASTVYKPSVRVDVLADASDNRILECALAAGADLIVTGDRHLLKLKKYQDIPIIQLADLLRMFPSESGNESQLQTFRQESAIRGTHLLDFAVHGLENPAQITAVSIRQFPKLEVPRLFL